MVDKIRVSLVIRILGKRVCSGLEIPGIGAVDVEGEKQKKEKQEDSCYYEGKNGWFRT